MKENDSRRNFIYNGLLATGGIILSANCISFRRDGLLPSEAIPNKLESALFDQGVASFDPTDSQVIIWTRYTTHRPSVSIAWQVASDPGFQNLVRSGKATTDSARDYTVAVELKELESGQKLYYRFMQLGDKTVSATGETLTFPKNPDVLSLAVCCCSNYPAGLFNAYRAIAESNADVVLHLGDYIYEYGAGEYGTNAHTSALNRVPNPSHELLSLTDYRTRYKQYRSDADLQWVHQKKPFICVWDDHEIANNTYKNGAENHQKSEGSFEVRKQSAIRAYSEYIPIRTADRNEIYRSLTIGNLVNLIMLDTRLIGRDKQLSYGDYFDPQGHFDSASFQADLFDPERTMLGATQKAWLLDELRTDSARWQVLGNQVLMGKMRIPVKLLPGLHRLYKEQHKKGRISDESRTSFLQSIKELARIKMRIKSGDLSVTPEEIAGTERVVPYNLDAWDGYPAEREEVLQACSGRNLVCLSGDSHNAWCNELVTDSGMEVGREFATTSISSPGMEVLFRGESEIRDFEQSIRVLIDDLAYANASERGFLQVNFTHSRVVSAYVFVDTVFSEAYHADTEKEVRYSV
ncbi:MAG: alkaline phosphatase D family protein [Flavobacteriales bacterium]